MQEEVLDIDQVIANDWDFEDSKSVANPEIKINNKNLFNKNNATNNRFANVASGALSTDDRFYVSEFIKLIPGEIYTLSDDAASGAAGHCFYDNEFNFISGVITQTFTIPSNAVYARVSVPWIIMKLSYFV